MTETCLWISNGICQFIVVYFLHSFCILAAIWVAFRLVRQELHGLRDYVGRIGLVTGVITAMVTILLPARFHITWETQAKQILTAPQRPTQVQTSIELPSESVVAGTRLNVQPQEYGYVDTAGLASATSEKSSQQVTKHTDSNNFFAEFAFCLMRSAGDFYQPIAGVVAGYWCVVLLLIGRTYLRLSCTVLRDGRTCTRAPRLMGQLRQRTGVREIRVYVHEEASQPFTFGFARPTVVLPTRLAEQLSDSDLRAVLAHECGHIASGHVRWILILTLVRRLFAFQPMNWWAYRKWRGDAELVADDWAVQSGIEGAELAKCLTTLAQFAFGATSPISLGVSPLSKSQLANRVTRLLAKSPHRFLACQVSRGKRIFTFSLFVCVAVGLNACTPILGGEGVAQSTNGALAGETDRLRYIDIQLAIEAIDGELRLLDQQSTELKSVKTQVIDPEFGDALKRLASRDANLRGKWNRIKELIATELRR